MANAWFLRFDGTNDAVSLASPIVLSGANRVEANGYVEFKVALRDDSNALSAEASNGSRIAWNRSSGLLLYSMDDGTELRFDGASAVPDLGVGGIYTIRIDTQAGAIVHTLTVNGTLIGSEEALTGKLSLSVIGKQASNYANMDLYYWHLVDRRTPANSFYYDATESSGAGSVLTDTSSNANNGTLLGFPSDNSQWILYDDGTVALEITNVDTDNTITDGQQDISIPTTGFTSPITTINLKVGDERIALSGLTRDVDTYTADLMDVTALTSGTVGLPFSSATYQNEIEATNGTDTAVINITRNPKAGWAVIDVVDGVNTEGSAFETRVGGAPSNASQILYPTANGTSITATGIITTDAQEVDGYLWNVTSGEWETWSVDFPLPDTTAPVITVSGQASTTVTVNGTAPTFTASTDDGSTVVVTGDTVDMTTIGTYVIRYNATDVAGNTATEVTRTVIVSAISDTTAPIITVSGQATTTITFGDALPTFTASTDDGSAVVTTGTAVNQVGTYTLRYNATDSAGNQAQEVTRVVVINAAAVNPTVTKTATFTLPEPIRNRVGVKFSVTDLNLNPLSNGPLTTTSANVTIDLDGVDVTSGQTLILFATDLTGSNDSTAYVMCDTANAVVTQG
jgi:hypothetical protein